MRSEMSNGIHSMIRHDQRGERGALRVTGSFGNGSIAILHTNPFQVLNVKHTQSIRTQ